MLKVKNLSISFDGKEIFNDINFIVNPNEKVGLIGRNGSGKSTIFKILSGKINNYDGEVVTPKNYKIGYLEQHLAFTEKTVLEEACLALPEYKKDFFWDAEKILTELGFSEEDKKRNPQEFSGGWQIRLNLAKLLISEPDIMLLDEPTNYLDILSIRWLKRFLKEYCGAIILITHDRSFMDEIIESTVIIHRGSSVKIRGNTEEMYEKIATDEDTYEKTRVNENKKKEQLQGFIDRFGYKATKARQAKSKAKMIEKMGVKDELADIKDLDFDFKYKEFSGNSKLLEVEDLAFGYEKDKLLFKNLNFSVENGDKICVVGKNGKGKSTLLRLLNKTLAPVEGKVNINNKTEIGYFGQMNIDTLNPNNTIEEELQTVDRFIPKSRIMAIAGLMMFSGDLAKKKISVLSGGEKSRVLLGKILLKETNLIILDEPTNHLDMESCEALSDALLNFKGASIIVSHNEHLLNNVANKLVVFDDDRAFVFEGNYAEFLEKIGWKSEDKVVKKKNCPVKVLVYDDKKEIQKLENIILEKEIQLEEYLKTEDYKNYGILQKEIDKLMEIYTKNN